MDGQRFFVKGVRFDAQDARLQDALAQIYGTPERAWCLCVPGGVEMYVAKHREYLVKRMPDKGHLHHPSCPSYEPDPVLSGLGAFLREAAIERSPEEIDLRVSFPMVRYPGRAAPTSAPQGPGFPATQVSTPQPRLGMQGLMHYVWERARFNRYYPAMKNKRAYGVIWRYAREGLEGVKVKGVVLADRFYIPEPFDPEKKDEIVERRRQAFSCLHSRDEDSQFRMMIVLGEYKASEAKPYGREVWLKHMPERPLFVEEKLWARIERLYAPMFQAQAIETPPRTRIIVCALVYAKREYVYQIDTVAFMLVSADSWIPVEGLHELELLRALTEQSRAFYKPLRYDAKNGAGLATALLLDTGDKPTALHVVGMEEKERAAKQKVLAGLPADVWVWHTDKPMPALPPSARSRISTTANG